MHYLNAAADSSVISASYIAEYILKLFTMIRKLIKRTLGGAGGLSLVFGYLLLDRTRALLYVLKMV